MILVRFTANRGAESGLQFMTSRKSKRMERVLERNPTQCKRQNRHAIAAIEHDLHSAHRENPYRTTVKSLNAHGARGESLQNSRKLSLYSWDPIEHSVTIVEPSRPDVARASYS
jgi:hypothetical protein